MLAVNSIKKRRRLMFLSCKASFTQRLFAYVKRALHFDFCTRHNVRLEPLSSLSVMRLHSGRYRTIHTFLKVVFPPIMLSTSVTGVGLSRSRGKGACDKRCAWIDCASL